MVSVKIECGCGQHYAFDVEPVDRRMASTVVCPVCGLDGTAAANAVIAGELPPSFSRPATAVKAPGPPAPGALLTISDSEDRQSPALPAGVKVNAKLLGLVDRATAETEARARISWGDSQKNVIKYLMLQGFSIAEASELVRVLFVERLAALRVKGTKKVMLGLGMMCVPVAAWFADLTLISYKLAGGAVGVGLWGCWLVLNGIIMLAAPRMESGDVAE